MPIYIFIFDSPFTFVTGTEFIALLITCFVRRLVLLILFYRVSKIFG